VRILLFASSPFSGALITVDTGQTRAAFTTTRVKLDENDAARKEAIT